MTRPYDEDGLLPYETVMASCPPVVLDPRALRPSQEFAVIARLVALARGEPPEGPDPFPHLVAFEGALYVHNGHHRWLRDLIRGTPTTARLQRVR